MLGNQIFWVAYHWTIRVFHFTYQLGWYQAFLTLLTKPLVLNIVVLIVFYKSKKELAYYARFKIVFVKICIPIFNRPNRPRNLTTNYLVLIYEFVYVSVNDHIAFSHRKKYLLNQIYNNTRCPAIKEKYITNQITIIQGVPAKEEIHIKVNIQQCRVSRNKRKYILTK